MAEWLTALFAGLTAVFTGLYLWVIWRRGLPVYHLLVEKVQGDRVDGTLRVSNPAPVEIVIVGVAAHRPRNLRVGTPQYTNISDGMSACGWRKPLPVTTKRIAYSAVIPPGGSLSLPLAFELPATASRNSAISVTVLSSAASNFLPNRKARKAVRARLPVATTSAQE